MMGLTSQSGSKYAKQVQQTGLDGSLEPELSIVQQMEALGSFLWRKFTISQGQELIVKGQKRRAVPSLILATP